MIHDYHDLQEEWTGGMSVAIGPLRLDFPYCHLQVNVYMTACENILEMWSLFIYKNNENYQYYAIQRKCENLHILNKCYMLCNYNFLFYFGIKYYIKY